MLMLKHISEHAYIMFTNEINCFTRYAQNTYTHPWCFINDSQLAKMKKIIPDMSLP